MVLHADLSARQPLPPHHARADRRDGTFYLALGHTSTPSPVCCTRGGQRLRIRAVRRAGASTSWGRRAFSSARSEPNGADMAFVPFARRHYQILRADVTDAAPLDAVERLLPCGRRRTSTASSSPASARRTSRSPRCRAVLRIAFSQLELRDETRAPEDLWARCGEDSLRGLFLQEMHRQLESAAPEDRAAIEQAVRFGLAAMDHRDL